MHYTYCSNNFSGISSARLEFLTSIQINLLMRPLLTVQFPIIQVPIESFIPRPQLSVHPREMRRRRGRVICIRMRAQGSIIGPVRWLGKQLCNGEKILDSAPSGRETCSPQLAREWAFIVKPSGRNFASRPHSLVLNAYGGGGAPRVTCHSVLP